MTIVWLSFLLAALVSTAFGAETPPPSALDEALQDAAHDFFSNDQLLVLYLANRFSGLDRVTLARDNSIAAAANSTRTDQQPGSSSSAKHATSIAERPGIADLLNLAIERGAVSKNAAGSGITLSTTPYAVQTFFGAMDTPERWKAAKILRDISLSSTFSSEDAARGNFSSFESGEVKWIVIGNRSPRDPELINAVRPALREAFLRADVLIDRSVCHNLLTSIRRERSELDKWLGEQKTAGTTLSADKVRQKLDELLGKRAEAADAVPCADLYEQGNTIVGAALGVLKTETKKYLDAAKAHQFALAALFVRDAQVSDYYVGKVLYALDRGAPLTLNANGEVNWNRSGTSADGTSLKRLRSYSTELSIDSQRFAGGRLDGGLAAKWSKAKDASSSNVVIQQAKLNLHLTEALTLPIALTYAQKETESIRRGWQFNFGLSGMLDDVLRQAFGK